MTAALLALALATTTPAGAAGWLVPPLRVDLAAFSATGPPPSGLSPAGGEGKGSEPRRAGNSLSPAGGEGKGNEPRRAGNSLSPAGGEGQGEGAARTPAAGQLHWKSPAEALGLSLALELPTLFIGPSLGHLWAGEWQHFAITGGARLADVTLLVLLEKFAPGFGVPPLVALLHPEHLGASFTGYPLGFTVDLILVLALVGSSIYDLFDSWRAAQRYDWRHGLLPPRGPSPAAAAAVPPPAR